MAESDTNDNSIRELFKLILESNIEIERVYRMANLEAEDVASCEELRKQRITDLKELIEQFSVRWKLMSILWSDSSAELAIGRTIGNRSTTPVFRGKRYRTNVKICYDIASLAIRWLIDLERLFTDAGVIKSDQGLAKLRKNLVDHQANIPATYDELDELRYEIEREKLWTEKDISPPPPGPETRAEEVDRIAKSLPGRQGPIFRFLAKHPSGVTFEQYKDAEDTETNRRLTKSDNHDSICSMIRRMSQNLDSEGWSVSASIRSNLIKAEKLAEQKT